MVWRTGCIIFSMFFFGLTSKSVGIGNRFEVCHPELCWGFSVVMEALSGRWMRIQLTFKCRPNYHMSLCKAFFGVKLVGFCTNSPGGHTEECPAWDHKLIPSCTTASSVNLCKSLCSSICTLQSCGSVGPMNLSGEQELRQEPESPHTIAVPHLPSS